MDENQSARELPSIEVILQTIGTERSKERETGAVARWLVEPLYGTARVHWLVSCAYIACPLSSLLVLVVAMESELCLVAFLGSLERAIDFAMGD